MPTQALATGNWEVPEYTGVLTVTITGGQGGVGGQNSPFSNSPFCDVPFGGVAPGSQGGTSSFDTFSALGGLGDTSGSGPTAGLVTVCVFQQFRYRPGMIVPVVLGPGGFGGAGSESGCGGATTGANGGNGTVVAAWTTTNKNRSVVVPF